MPEVYLAVGNKKEFQIWPNWTRLAQMCDFLRSIFCSFCLIKPNEQKTDLKKPQICPMLIYFCIWINVMYSINDGSYVKYTTDIKRFRI